MSYSATVTHNDHDYKVTYSAGQDDAGRPRLERDNILNAETGRVADIPDADAERIAEMADGMLDAIAEDRWRR